MLYEPLGDCPRIQSVSQIMNYAQFLDRGLQIADVRLRIADADDRLSAIGYQLSVIVNLRECDILRQAQFNRPYAAFL